MEMVLNGFFQHKTGIRRSARNFEAVTNWGPVNPFGKTNKFG